MQRLLLIVAGLSCVGGCAGPDVYRSIAYRDVATALFPPPSGYGIGPVYTVNYARADSSVIEDRSYDRFNSAYQQLLSDVDSCAAELDARLVLPGARLSPPTIPIASVQLLECVESRGWVIGVEAMWITD